MIKTLIISLYVISAINSDCTDGCLKCDGSVCRLCDFTLGYTLSGSGCTKITLENCITMNQRGKCLACESDYYLDPNTSKCVAVASTDLIDNCRSYSGLNTCSVCDTGFYLENGACSAVATKIDKCDIQSNSGTCITCQSGYYLSLDKTQCIAGNSSDKCASYTNIECTSCSSGYVKNFNNYLYQFINLSSPTFEDDVTTLILNHKNKHIDGKNLRVCQAVQLNNCAEYDTFNKCRLCNNEYYLDANKRCVKNPFMPVKDCEIYSDLTNCKICKPGFYLESSNNCVESPAVENCEVYANADNSSECIKCKEGFYLLTFNACVPRKVLTIPNCITLRPNAEACLECNVAYRATDDGVKCLDIIANCALYEPSNLLSNELNCYKCDNGYYYDVDSNSCFLGTVPNCDIYEKTKNICSRCVNKFYLEDDTCKAHDILLNCEIYHPTLKNVCSTCDNKTYLFEKDNQCVAVSTISKCTQYSTRTTCEICEDGYYINNNSCVQIPISENCLQRIGTKCGKCIKDFVLEDGVCRDSLDYIVNECETDNIDGTVNFAKSKCSACKQNTFPLSYEDAYVCVETHYMTTLRNGVALTTNCIHYAPLEDGTYECTKCVDGKYLDNGSCVSSCTNANRLTLYRQIIKASNAEGDKHNESFYVEKVNVCWTTIDGCAIAAPNVTQNKVELINYQCIQCNTNRIPRVAFNNDMTLIRDASDAVNPYGTSPVARAPGFECYDPTAASAKMVGDVNSSSKKVANCDYYKTWGNITGCLKCSHGYTGVVLDVVSQCDIYINDAYTCKQCKQGYYLATAYECKQVVEIEFCTSYSTTSSSTICTQCSSTKYLNGNVCSSRVNSLNVLNSTVVVSADNITCNTGYFKVTSSSPYRCVAMNTNCINGAMVSNAFQCSECDHTKSYFDSSTKLCITGSKSNCKTYHNTANTCIECNNNYYLNNGSCIANTSGDTNCTTWSGSTKNTCTTCNDDSILFTVNNKCRSVTSTITDCLEYDSLTTCSTCTAGTRLENLKTRCLTIPVADNCAVSTVMDYNKNGAVDVGDAPTSGPNAGIFYYTCDKCDNNTSRHTRSTITAADTSTIAKYECFSELSYKLDECATNNITGVEDFSSVSCTSCNNGFYPRDWAGRYMCIETTYFSLKSSVAITNCERLEWSNADSKYICTRCAYPYFLQADDTCASTCTAGSHGVFSFFTTTTNAGITSIDLEEPDSTCVTNAAQAYLVTNCQIYSAYFDYSGYACIKCNSGYIPVIDYTSLPVIIDGYTSTTGKPVSPISVYPSITSCDQASYNDGTIVTVQGGPDSTSNLINRCKYYTKFETITGSPDEHVYGCVRCDYGYTGTVYNYTFDDGTTLGGYIDLCGSFNNDTCDTTYTDKDNAIGLGLSDDYINAHLALTKYFSCLVCSDADFIPFVFVQSDAANTDQFRIAQLKSYDLTNVGATYDDVATIVNAGYAVDCIEVYNGGVSQISTVLNTTDDSFPTNCALGILNVDSDKDATDSILANVSATTKLAAYCVACKPGYAPTYIRTNDDSADIFHVIASCNLIDDCDDAGTWFNSCADCIHYYDIYTDTIDYTRCISNGPSNCFAAYEVGPCVICEKGYDKDDEGNCVQEHVPICTQPNNNRNYRYYFDDDDVLIGMTSAYLYGEEEELGCRACPDDYILTELTHNAGTLYDTNLSKYICNDFISEPDHADKPDEDNCLTYGVVSGNIKCKSCAGGYILTEDYKCKQAVINNCQIIKATDGYTCIQCQNGYLNVGGRCYDVTTLIDDHCSSFDDSSLLTYAKCNACKNGYVIRSDGSWCDQINNDLYPNCVALSGGVCTKCDSLYALTTLASGVKYCYPLYDGANMQFDNNCLTINETKFNNNKQLECTTCKANYIIEAGNTDYPTHCATFFRGVVDNCKQYYSSGALNSVSLKCQNCDSVTTHYYKTATFQCIARTAVTHCATYETNLDKCSVCADNYALSEDGLTCTALPGAIVSPNRAPNGGYIQKCLSMSTCSSKVKYDGLGHHLESLFSCHKCASSGLIPLAIVRSGETFGAIEGLQEFGFNPTAGERYDTKSGESAITCISPVRATFNIDAGKFNFPTNCGAAILNANSVADATSSASATNVDKTKIAVMCVACAPGYAPTGATDAGGNTVPYMVSSCTQITNCESSLWFSACSQCKSNYSYGYTEDVGILYDRCISYTSNPNCYAVDNSDTNNVKCKYCRKGYYLNKDGYCELLHPPRCSYAEFRFKREYKLYDLGSGLFISNDGIGCQKCDDGFVGLFNAASDKQICTQSPYHTNGLVTANSKFIAFCKNYSVGHGNDHKCALCQDGYVLTVEGKCVVSTQISNCVLAYSVDSCYKCNASYVLVNRKCVAGTITNCIEYANNEIFTKQVCTRCGEGYYLKDNTCNAGTITQCKVYANINTCNECLNGYGLVKSKNGFDYCYPIDASLNCSELDYYSLLNGRLQCKTCNSNSFVISTDQSLYNRNLCMAFNELANCVKYDITPNIQDSSFNCALCAEGFYLKEGACSIRTVSLTQCARYAIDSDVCLECQPGHFLDSKGVSCSAYPNGIAGCDTYQTVDTCARCKKKFYLKDNTCTPVAEKDLIANCAYYDDSQTCSECDVGFIANEGNCEIVKAQNCATYENANACETCPDGYGFKLIDGLLNCIQKNVLNCRVSENIEPYNCLICESGYYVNNNVCEAVPTSIANCIEYASATVCNKCDKGTALSTDSQSCVKTTDVISVLDTNCSEAKLTDDLICNSCEPGYVFTNGVCTACNQNTIDKGCYVCNPEDPGTCLMCASGYYQYTDGTCVKNGIVPEDPDDPDTPDSLVALKAIAIAVLMLIFV